MRAEHRQKQTATSPLAVVLTCQWCGKRVEITTSDAGPQIQDAKAFLEQHRRCLHRGGVVE